MGMKLSTDDPLLRSSARFFPEIIPLWANHFPPENAISNMNCGDHGRLSHAESVG